MSDAGTIARRLSTGYFTYFAAVGLEYVYLPLFFARVGLSPADIGILYAGRIGTMIVFQPLTTRIAERTGRPYLTLKLSMLMGLLCASGLYFAHTLWIAALFMWTQAAFRSVAIPILDATTIHERGAESYGKTRLWGSLGYGIAALGLASLVGTLAYDQAGAMALPAYLGANALMVVAMFWVPGDLRMESQDVAATPSRTLTAGLIALMAIGAVHWASVETYNVFFSTFARERGFAPNVPGIGVGVGIAAEVTTFYFFESFVRRAPAATWLVVSLALSTLRWLATAYAPTAPLFIVAQVGHSMSFALWWASILAVFGQNAPTGRRAALQGLFTAAIMGCGGAFGTAVAGRIFAHYGGQLAFTGAAALDVLAVGLALATRPLWSQQDGIFRRR